MRQGGSVGDGAGEGNGGGGGGGGGMPAIKGLYMHAPLILN